MANIASAPRMQTPAIAFATLRMAVSIANSNSTQATATSVLYSTIIGTGFDISQFPNDQTNWSDLSDDAQNNAIDCNGSETNHLNQFGYMFLSTFFACFLIIVLNHPPRLSDGSTLLIIARRCGKRNKYSYMLSAFVIESNL